MGFSMPTAKVVLISWKFKEMVMMMLMEYDLGAHTYTGTLIRTYKPYTISSLNQNWENAKTKFLPLLGRIRY